MQKHLPVEPSRRSGTDRRPAPVVSSAALFRGERELRILHGHCEYRLRHTASGKLILTK